MEQREGDKIDQLAHEITRLITRVDYHEKEMLENKRVSDGRFAKLEEKIDHLNDRFSEVSNEVRTLATKIAGGAIALGLFAQLIMKHFGWL